MATTKGSAKASPGKRPAPAPRVTSSVTSVKSKPVTKAKAAAKPQPVARAAPKAAKKAAPRAAAKPASAGAKKPAGIPSEQRRNYVEMAAYYIAERRAFAPGNPLEDWVQAEAEIDRLLAEGRLGR